MSLSNLVGCVSFPPIPDVPWCGELIVSGGQACTTTISKKRKRYTKEEFEALQKALPAKKKFLLKTSPEGYGKIRKWIFEVCALNDSCRAAYLNGELGEFEKGVGL